MRGAKWARRRPFAAASLVIGVSLTSGAIAGLVTYQQTLIDRGQTILARLAHGNALQREADLARSDRELDDAQLHLSEFFPTLKEYDDDPRIKDLALVVVHKRDEIRSRLEVVRTERTRQEKLGSERSQFQQFHDLRRDALFHDTPFTGLDFLSNQAATRRSAEAALNLYAMPNSGESWTLAPVPPSLSGRERSEVSEGCYELLLVLADTESSPEHGLRRLDQAARLRPETTAYHLRRATCLERAGQSEAAEQEREAAKRVQPFTAFDHFLLGQERFKRGDISAAIRHLSAAMELRSDHFWTQGLWAVACLQVGQPAQAKTALTACLNREPEFAWLYLLRGVASYQLAIEAHKRMEKVASQTSIVKTEMDLQIAAAGSDFNRAAKLLEERPNNELSYALYVNGGLLSLERKDFEKAILDLEAAIRLDIRKVQAYVALARVYREQRQLEKSIEQYTRVIAVLPRMAALYRDRAGVILEQAVITQSKRGRRSRIWNGRSGSKEPTIPC